jgi:3-(3-hydroxy-phenyl)propionate hydroxylase
LGATGGCSLIRKVADIGFPGWDPTKSWLIAEVEVRDEPEWGFRHDAVGTHAIGKLEKARQARVVLTEQQPGSVGEPTLHDVSEALISIYGTDFGIHSPTWISRFTDMTRQAAAYRARRILLAGDAAHVHPPLGGQGLNIGVQDAMNLGWKLAQVVKRISPECLLDTYHTERHPTAARVLRNTMAAVALSRPDDGIKALSEIVSELLGMNEPRRRLAGAVSGLDVHYEVGHYDLDKGHPLLGRRMPDLDLVTAEGPMRLFTLLHGARAVLLNLGEPGGFDVTPWAERVQLIDAQYGGTWEVPVLGAVSAPAAVLVRPDGYVAWVGDPDHPGLQEALTTWFGGEPQAASSLFVVSEDLNLQ